MRALAAVYLVAVVACHGFSQFSGTVYKRNGEDVARREDDSRRRLDEASKAIGQWLAGRLKVHV